MFGLVRGIENASEARIIESSSPNGILRVVIYCRFVCWDGKVPAVVSEFLLGYAVGGGGFEGNGCERGSVCLFIVTNLPIPKQEQLPEPEPHRWELEDANCSVSSRCFFRIRCTVRGLSWAAVDCLDSPFWSEQAGPLEVMWWEHNYSELVDKLMRITSRESPASSRPWPRFVHATLVPPKGLPCSHPKFPNGAREVLFLATQSSSPSAPASPANYRLAHNLHIPYEPSWKNRIVSELASHICNLVRILPNLVHDGCRAAVSADLYWACLRSVGVLMSNLKACSPAYWVHLVWYFSQNQYLFYRKSIFSSVNQTRLIRSPVTSKAKTCIMTPALNNQTSPISWSSLKINSKNPISTLELSARHGRTGLAGPRWRRMSGSLSWQFRGSRGPERQDRRGIYQHSSRG